MLEKPHPDAVIIDYMPGFRVVWYWEDEENHHVVTDYLNAEATRQANAESVERTEGRRFGDYRPLLSMPPNEFRTSGIEEALRQGDDRFVRRFFNDGDNRGYRTSRGRL